MKIKRSLKQITVDEMLLSVVQAKKRKEEAEHYYKLQQQSLIEMLESNQQKSATVRDGGKKYKITYVRGERTVIDSDALRKELGTRIFNKYTVRTLDRKKLEEGIARGDVDKVLVSKHMSLLQNAASLRVTEQVADDREET